MLSRLVITFLPRSKHLLNSWLQSPSAVILEPKKANSDTVSTVSPSISHEVMGPDAMIFVSPLLYPTVAHHFHAFATYLSSTSISTTKPELCLILSDICYGAGPAATQRVFNLYL